MFHVRFRYICDCAINNNVLTITIVNLLLANVNEHIVNLILKNIFNYIR